MGTQYVRGAVLTPFAKTMIQFKAKQLSKKPGFRRTDKDDISQELTARLLDREHKFDPGRGSPDRFAHFVIRSAIAMLLRGRRRQKRALGFATQSLERTFIEQDRSMTWLRDLLCAADLDRRTSADSERRLSGESLSDFVEVLWTLPSDLQDLCRRLVDGTVTSVARDLGVSRRQLYNSIKCLRSRFHAFHFGKT